MWEMPLKFTWEQSPPEAAEPQHWPRCCDAEKATKALLVLKIFTSLPLKSIVLQSPPDQELPQHWPTPVTELMARKASPLV